MPRKKETVRVPAEWGARDANKLFLLTEMSAADAEKWGLRMFLVVKGTSAQIPDGMAALGMIAVAIRGINAILAADIEWTKLEPLLDEMMTCVQIVRDPSHPDVATALVSADDIEEARTIGWLRSEVLRLHTNFSFTEALSKWASIMTSQTSPSPTM
jgi:hypothetical protein